MNLLRKNLQQAERAGPLRTLLLLQAMALVVFFGVTAFAVLARSLMAAIASGIALTISFACGYAAGRLMRGGER